MTDTDTDIDTDDVGRIVSSKKFYTALRVLREQPMTPSALMRASKLTMGDASRATTVLAEMGAAELLVDEDRRKGRIYGITDYGEAILDYVDEDAPSLKPDSNGCCPTCGHERGEEAE